ncbi:MAG TPA: PKD domain-containing protein [Gemmatimonadales bacterium]|nr:PKD domain-containing protein [Gemmatimonadales bacterium]
MTVFLTTCSGDRSVGPGAASSGPIPEGATGTVVGQVLVGAGDIARCDRTNDEATAAILDTIPGAVFTLGDNVLGGSSNPPDFINCYNPSWGRHKARTRPTIGHMEGFSPGSSTYVQYFGAAAGDSGKWYYSYDLGSWHIVVLNSNISTSAGSPQEQWLKADLAAHPAQCTLAMWHVPLFSSTSSNGLPAVYSAVKPLWDDLYAAGAEIVLNSHYEVYERFAPQRSDGTPDPQLGIRQFTVGTGGIGVNSFNGGLAANSEVHNSGTPGVLKLILGDNGYSWKFIPIAGFTFTDSGTYDCHGTTAGPPVSSVAVSPNPASVEVGVDVQLTATPLDASGNPLSDRLVTWSTSNTAVAKVNGSGDVFGWAPGTATITATSDGVSGTTTVTVVSTTAATLVGAGDIAVCNVPEDEATAALIDNIQGTVFTAGDNAYPDGTADQFNNCYTPSWGRFLSRTRPSPGNHDYTTAGAPAYYNYFGASAGDPTKGYYSYDLGAWHVIVVNNYVDASAGSTQEQWLKADLAASTKQCTAAIWHEPKYSSGILHGDNNTWLAIWTDLYEAGAEIIINGHEHTYERFAPMTPNGVADPVNGIREFVVGTGGAGLEALGTIEPNSEAVQNSAHGVLRLVLRPTGYQWRFFSEAGQTFSDTGSAPCHGPPTDKPPIASFTTSCSGLTCHFTDASTDPDGSVVAWSWTFGDGATATGQNAAHVYTAGGTYTVSLTVTDNSGSTGSTSQSITVAPPDVPPTASFTRTCTGLACSFTSTSSDPDGTVVAWSWTFGDGATATTANPSHTYAAGGTFTVNLSVTDNSGGTGTTSQTVTVSPQDVPPTASFTQSCTGLTCNFTSTSTDPDGTVVGWSWAFGDGATATIANPSHTYAAGGTYTVTLTVTDNSSGTGSTSQSVTVTPPDVPPTASFTRSCTGLTCNFTSTSSDPDGTVVGWSWTFGDGATATTANPTHTYAAGGTYTVALTVTDNSGSTGTTSQSITVAPANTPPTASFTKSCTNLTCSFTSTSTDPDGTVVGWSWTFGDGATATTANPSHTYAAGGTYTVTLTVTDNSGGTGSTSQNVTVTPPDIPPTASFTRNCTGLGCSFTSTSSDPDGTVVAWLWSFGDGATSTAQNPNHTYAAGGTYTVGLTVTDNGGSTGATSQSVTVTAPDLPPTASFTKSCTNLTCSFTSTSTDPDGSVVAWSWTFGDGGTSTAQNPAHTYAVAGTYTVGLTVTDNSGSTNSTSQTVTVTAPGPSQVLVGAGDIARCDRTNDEATAALINNIPGAVFTVGDNTLGSSTSPPDFIGCYDPSWGQFKARTRPAIGHMEGFSPGSSTYVQYFGAAAGDSGKWYYSYDLGSWHIVVLNSNISTAAGSPQELWLKNDLATSTKQCTIAIWHLPRFSSTSGTGLPVVNDAVLPLWNDLYSAGAEIVINAHYEVYERFALQTPGGVADPQLGIRQFTVGTGGIGINSFKGGTAANSEVHNSGTPGVLKLTLSDNGYAWQFIPIAGMSFTDSGSGSCH